jgi:hypothetical protein
MKNKMIRLRQIAGLTFITLLMACGNNNSDSKSNTEKKDSTSNGMNPTVEMPAAVSAEAMDKAVKDEKSVFLLITATGATGVEKAVTLVNQAKAKVSKSVVYLLKRDEPANNKLVSKYDVANVSVPFILVISPQGNAVIGDEPSKFTVDMLVKSIPSPKEDDVYSGITDKKPVFIVVSKKGYTDKAGVLSNCKTACSSVASKPIIVEIDFDDSAEKKFLEQIGVTEMKGTTTTVVTNSSGQITETFTKMATVKQLIDAANKVIKKSGGCCPEGSGKSCG